MSINPKRFLWALLCAGAGAAQAQVQVNMSECRILLRTAQELYEKAMYAPAQQEFVRLQNGHCAEAAQAQTAFYIAACAIHLDAPNAETAIQDFLLLYPQSRQANDALYLLAKLYFGKGKYPEALAAFQTFDPASLPSYEMPEYQFKYGYALFAQEQYYEASALFDKIREDSSRYSAAATYYFAHIAYDQKNYNVAAECFEKLTDDRVFGKLAPYYLIHIAHEQRDYDRAISRGEAFMANVSAKRMPEIARIIGEAYYFTHKYDKALPFIEKFMATAPALTRADRYLMGYIYYHNKNYVKAKDLFEQIVAGEDSLAQMAHYYLADAYLHTGKKINAGRAFAQASKMNCIPEIKEDAMYNYAKLMFDLKSGPFTGAIDALTDFQKAYPASPHNDEINAMLMQAYVWSHNYRAAWKALASIKKPDRKTLALRQKVAYYLAVEKFQDGEYEQAAAYCDSSMQYAAYSPAIAALASYWKGEAYFNIMDYEAAKTQFSEFMLMSAAKTQEEYKQAHYSLAYCYYKLGSLETAQSWFARFAAMHPKNSQMLGDAFCRMGDYNFGHHHYSKAIEEYAKAIDMNTANADYAVFQCGLCYGQTGNTDKKIELMNKVIKWQPKSSYADNALFEKGRTYAQMQDYPKAIAVYNEVLRNSQNAFYAKTLVELGLIYINIGKINEAERYYKQAAEQYPGTPEMRTALVGIRAIYMEQSNVDGYFRYVAALKGNMEINIGEKDSMSFAAAQHTYFADKQELAISLLEKYIADFPNGAFLLDVNFYLADLYLRTGKDSLALPHYEAVVQFPRSEYTSSALDALSAICFNSERYDRAAQYYSRMIEIAGSHNAIVKARRGKTLSSYMQQDWDAAINDASALLQDSAAIDKSLRQEMRYVRAKCYEQTEGLSARAAADFAAIAGNVRSVEGAEAAYKTIEYEFNKGDFGRVENDVIRFSKSGSPHDYWIARAFILLGDAYVQKGDAFQAKATYQSIAQGYKTADDGIKDAVQQRITQLMTNESVKETQAEQNRYNSIY